MTFRHFESIEESWKHGGAMWQVLYDGTTYDVGTNPLCTNCLCELDNSLKCTECGKQHKLTMDKLAAATQASKSYNAARRRKTYTITAPQIGRKIADVDLDLPDSEFMNVTLEERKGTTQVVISVGKEGSKKKAQIFVDLTKHEIRHDQTDLNPDQFIDSVELKGVQQNIKKQFRHDDDTTLEHPYIYVSGSSHNNTEITLSIKSDEPEEYFLENIELEDASSIPNRALAAKSITKGIRIDGFTHPFKNPQPRIKLTVSRGGKTYLIEQFVRTGSRADGKYNLVQWIERPESIRELG